MAEIVLVDDDANILASVRIALEADGFACAAIQTATRHLPRSKTNLPILACSTLKCRAWTGWNCFENCAKQRNACGFSHLQG